MITKTPAQQLWDRKHKLDELFGVGAGQCIDVVSSPSRSMLPGMKGLFGMIDICALDDFLHERNDDYADTESMSDFITRKFGKEASDWVEANI